MMRGMPGDWPILVLLTDLEYDILEYSKIYHAQTRFDSLHSRVSTGPVAAT